MEKHSIEDDAIRHVKEIGKTIDKHKEQFNKLEKSEVASVISELKSMNIPTMSASQIDSTLKMLKKRGFNL